MRTQLSYIRPSDTTAYAAGDVVGTLGGAALSFLGVGGRQQEVIITSAQLEIDLTAVPSGMTSFRLHLYGITPPSALADNASWDLPSGDRVSYRGYIDLGSPVDVGSTLYVQADGINKHIRVGRDETTLYGYLVTNGGYTPASGTVYVVTLYGVPVVN